MDVEEKKISVVSIWSDNRRQGSLTVPKYIKKLKITDNSVSFKKQVFEHCYELDTGETPGQVVDSWEIRSNTERYQYLFHWVHSDLDGLKRASPKRKAPDDTLFTVRVTYADGTHKTHSFHGDCHLNGLDHFAYLVRELIPRGFDHPEELDLHDLANLDDERLDELISILEERPEVDSWHMYRWMLDIGDLMCPDFKYWDRIENIKSKEIHIEHFDVDDVRAYLTYYFRGEHFCDGHMAKEIRSGVVLKVLKRLSEIYKAYKNECLNEGEEDGGQL